MSPESNSKYRNTWTWNVSILMLSSMFQKVILLLLVIILAAYPAAHEHF